MNDKVIFDTNAIDDLISIIKQTSIYVGSSIKSDVSNKEKILKELSLFLGGINVINSQIDVVSEELNNMISLLLKHKEECEILSSDIKKYVSSIKVVGDNNINSLVAKSDYKEVNLNNITYSKSVNNNIITTIPQNVEITNINKEELENINNNIQTSYVEVQK